VGFLVSLVLACGLPGAAGAAPLADSARAVAPVAGPVQGAPWPGMDPFGPSTGVAAPQRPRAVEMSDAYHVRLTIHYVASFATLPLFVAEYVLGTKLYRDPPGSRSTREAHRMVALGLGGLFAVNTVTGVWNLWDSRKQPTGRLVRYLHGGLMLAADAGFLATAMVAPHGRRVYSATPANRSLHRALALSSMGTALASYAIVLILRH
jgi:hypothetical protein